MEISLKLVEKCFSKNLGRNSPFLKISVIFFRAPSAREKILDHFLIVFPCKTTNKSPTFSRAPNAREFFQMELAFSEKTLGELAQDLRKTPGELALITPVKGGGN